MMRGSAVAFLMRPVYSASNFCAGGAADFDWAKIPAEPAPAVAAATSRAHARRGSRPTSIERVIVLILQSSGRTKNSTKARKQTHNKTTPTNERRLLAAVAALLFAAVLFRTAW